MCILKNSCSLCKTCRHKMITSLGQKESHCAAERKKSRKNIELVKNYANANKIAKINQ